MRGRALAARLRTYCDEWGLKRTRPASISLSAFSSSSSRHDSGEDPSTSGRSWEDAHAKSQQSAPLHPSKKLETKLLFRDFIQNSLYHPVRGFFNRPQSVVGSLQTPIDHWKLYCADEWRRLINQKYQELEASFLTPAELFSPWYGYILARHVLEHRKHTLGLEGLPLRIIEIGGGNGTLAKDMLDWIRDNRPDAYASTSYTCLEISSSMASQQYDKVVKKGGHGGRFHLLRGSAWDPRTWGKEPVWDHTYVLMMEVLDNLPHDRVYRRSEVHPWHQTYVVALPDSETSSSGSREQLFSGSTGSSNAPARAQNRVRSKTPSMEDGPWREELGPLDDPLIERALASVYTPTTLEQRMDKRLNRLLDFILGQEGEPDVPEGELFFVPTAALALLDTLHHARPNHSLIATDFDRLPDVRIPGRNAPLVAEKVGGKNIDHSTILVPWGSSDIFFPTDFDALARMYKASAETVWGAGNGTISTSHYVQGAVMKRYREMERTATICAFNPMIDDFQNARFFFGDCVGRSAAAASQPGVPEHPSKQQRRERLEKGRHQTLVDWGGPSSSTKQASPIYGPHHQQHLQHQHGPSVQKGSVPKNLPEWAQKKLLEQQQQQQRQQQQQQQQQQHQQQGRVEEHSGGLGQQEQQSPKEPSDLSRRGKL